MVSHILPLNRSVSWVRVRCWLALLAIAYLACGCASLPAPQPRPPTTAYASPQATALGRLVMASGPDKASSGFRLVVSGEDAFGSLVALIDNAERTLDMQYYIIEGDASGRALLARVRAAADRGVRVRMLVDDLNTTGSDTWMLHMTHHANIEVRLYNPFPAGRFSTVSKVASSLTDFDRINHRMHNKMTVADNAVAMSGGRNLGDAYFLHSASSNFVDLDVIVAGKAVRSLSSTFDKFWNDPLAYPVDTIASEPAASAPPEPRDVPAPADSLAKGGLKENQLAREIKAGRMELAWASSTLVADQPSRFSEGDSQPVADKIADLMAGVKNELVVISPYFVPGQEGMKAFTALRDRGVKLRVLTNSLATTDAPAVHIGYSRYRVPMLDIGTELYELRPRIGAAQRKIGSFGSSQASLHAKALVLDRSTVVIGSMNMDPRSAKLNSEIGLVIRSPMIASQLVQLFDDVSRAGGYRVTLNADRHLRWTAELPDDGRPPAGALAAGADAPPQDGEVVFNDEPEASAWLKLMVKVLAPFAPEEML